MSNSATVSVRAADASDLFEMEAHFLDSYRDLGACDVTRQIAESIINCLRVVVSTEDELAESARMLRDEERERAAWMRGTFARTIVKAMESRLRSWFSN